MFYFLFYTTSPQTSQQSGGNLKSMKEKSSQQDKDTQEGSGSKTVGLEGEIITSFYYSFQNLYYRSNITKVSLFGLLCCTIIKVLTWWLPFFLSYIKSFSICISQTENSYQHWFSGHPSYPYNLQRLDIFKYYFGASSLWLIV